MPSPFAITTTANAVSLDAQRRSEASFTVSNTSGSPIRGRAQLTPDSPASTAWLTLTEEAEQNFPTGGTQQYTVKIAVPADTPAGTYSFRLNMVGVENPDELFTQGPTVTFQVPEPEPKKPFPWWIVIVAVGVLALCCALSIGGYFVAQNMQSTPTQITDTPTPTATPTQITDTPTPTQVTDTPTPTATPTQVTDTPTPTPTPTEKPLREISVTDPSEGTSPDFRKLTVAYGPTMIHVTILFYSEGDANVADGTVYLHGTQHHEIKFTSTSFQLRKDAGKDGHYEELVYSGSVTRPPSSVGIVIPIEHVPDIATKNMWLYSMSSKDRVPNTGGATW